MRYCQQAFMVVMGAVLASGAALAYVGVTTKIDDLYRMAMRMPEFQGMARPSFDTLVRSAKLAKLVPAIQKLPQSDRLATLLEIAEQRGLASTTQLGQLASKYKAVDRGDELLIDIIEYGDRNLLALAPKYGQYLLSQPQSFRMTLLKVLAAIGDEGFQIAKTLSQEQSVQLAKHADGMAKLIAADKQKVLDRITEYPARALKFLDDNPGILHQATGATAFIMFIDNISEPTAERITRPDGTVIETTKGYFSEFVPYFRTAMALALVGFAIWLVIRLRGAFLIQQFRIGKKAPTSQDSSTERKADKA